MAPTKPMILLCPLIIEPACCTNIYTSASMSMPEFFISSMVHRMVVSLAIADFMIESTFTWLLFSFSNSCLGLMLNMALASLGIYWVCLGAFLEHEVTRTTTRRRKVPYRQAVFIIKH